MEKPIYEHGCEVCIFIPKDDFDYDLYICPQDGSPTVILRYGDDGPEYESCPLDIILDSCFTVHKDQP